MLPPSSEDSSPGLLGCDAVYCCGRISTAPELSRLLLKIYVSNLTSFQRLQFCVTLTEIKFHFKSEFLIYRLQYILHLVFICHFGRASAIVSWF